MKSKITSIKYNRDRQSVTIKFNKKYTGLGLGAVKIADMLLRFDLNQKPKLTFFRYKK